MLGIKKQQSDVIDLSNRSLQQVLESLEYKKHVRYGDEAFESCDFKQLKSKSLLLYEILVGFRARIILNDFSYRFDKHSIERTHPDKIKPNKKRKWIPI